MSQKIYFDESGFTGNNLLSPNQEFFSYSSVATNDDEAKDFVEYLIKKYSIQNSELKGRQLVKSSKGRKAISEIMRKFRGRIKISLSNKKYALASKFFEYIFEPCISEQSSMFYDINFHRFIANILYIELATRGAGAEEILLEFESLMRSDEEVNLENIFSSSTHPENSPILVQIREFAENKKSSIKQELDSLADNGLDKWILDLTDSSLFTLLAAWGQEYEQLTAICDDAKPLHHDQQLYKVMINREDKKYLSIAGDDHPITFNLSGSIKLVASKTYHGIQLADTIAAASIFAITNNSDKHALKWRKYISEIIVPGSLFPDINYIDLSELEAQRNAVLLQELHSRSKEGIPLLEGMHEYIQFIGQQLMYNSIIMNA